MIDVFKTNVRQEEDAEKLAHLLAEQFPGSRIDFDLEDRDRILRIAHSNIAAHKVTQVLHHQGFTCAELPD